uniref:Sorting nexin-33-like n=1 Tax=Petromyzon marinus TaxID=7757 RepID=A0AAJ7U4F2_PETMA|nr:sorting nexin-33-like [Petromyzon marinus]
MSKDSRSEESSRNVWNATADGHLPRQAFNTFEEDPEQTEATALPPCPAMMYSLVNYRNLSPAVVLHPSLEAPCNDRVRVPGPSHRLLLRRLLPPSFTRSAHVRGFFVRQRRLLLLQRRRRSPLRTLPERGDGGHDGHGRYGRHLPAVERSRRCATRRRRRRWTRLAAKVRDGDGVRDDDGTAATEAATDRGRCVAIGGAHGTPEWLDDPARFTCAVSAPSKRSKFGGIKSYLAYELTTSSSSAAAAAAADSPAPSPVWRRYKQFAWLRARLEEKFPAVVVPRLPGTLPAAARYAPECVRRRVGELSLWLEHVTGHPALAGCDVLRHFLTCGDNVEEWKGGKRRAERDRDVGHSFYLGVDVRCAADLQHAEELAKSMKLFPRERGEQHG